MTTDRREFLRIMGVSAAAGAAANTFPSAIAEALQTPAANETGTIRDVKHVVILMQENRSFDHYFGTLRGVRGPRFSTNRPHAEPLARSQPRSTHGLRGEQAGP